VEWWTWLIATGAFMACTWGSKVNGILTVVTIGIAVLIDLWDLLDIKKDGHTMVCGSVDLLFTVVVMFLSRITLQGILWRGLLV
jgi:dolichyl-phosphate-mannose--protein O-mannosyl transferase